MEKKEETKIVKFSQNWFTGFSIILPNNASAESKTQIILATLCITNSIFCLVSTY
jgi:hypothetical protein